MAFPHGWTRADVDALDALFVRARAENLWFFCRYQSIWFSPDELAAAHEDSRFLWGAASWELRDPQEGLAALQEARERATREKAAFEARMIAGRK